VETAPDGTEPPTEILSYSGPNSHGMPSSAEVMTKWLRARARWRADHGKPLPALLVRDRCALWSLDVPQVLVDGEGYRPPWDDRTESYP